MDDFNNFFDDQRNDNNGDRTPIYHTPEPNKDDNKKSTILGICIAISVIMCIVVIVNVLVLASLKNQIASEYAASLSQKANEEYSAAINGILSNSDITKDIKDAATEQVVSQMSSSVGTIANVASNSVARIYMYKSPTDQSDAGLASAFLITDSVDGSERYLITNAHCVRYVKPIEVIQNRPWGGSYVQLTGYEWASYGKIIGYFEGEEEEYNMEIVAYGYYDPGTDSTYGYDLTTYWGLEKINGDQPDLAILKIKGTQPDNTKHPSLKVVSNDNSPSRGADIAVIGNPQGVGTTNSIAIGVISQTGVEIQSWGAGTFYLTDAAINGGNSGGPMINQNGNVVGVVESKLVSTSIENMGFVLDAKTINNFISWVQTKYSITIPYQKV